MEIKKLTPRVPVELRGFKLEGKEGLKEMLDQLIGELPIVVMELPQVEGTKGFGIRLHHTKQGWTLDIETGDWIVADNYGSVMCMLDAGIEDDFEITELEPATAE